MAKVRQVFNLLDNEYEQNSSEPEVSNTHVVGSEHPMASYMRQSPCLIVFCDHHTTRVTTIGSGATGNMIHHSTAQTLGCVVDKSSQSALHVVPDCSFLHAPLDSSTAGCQANYRVEWTDTLRKAFKRAQHISAHTLYSPFTRFRPCVQAYEKLCCGEFSVSPLVSTLLSVVSRYQTSVRHLCGSPNVPSDFASRNEPMCTDRLCRICTFIKRMEDSVVQRITTADITSGKSALPYSSRSAWLASQSECPDMRRTHEHRRQGKRPSNKITKARDVQRYLNVATVAQDSHLVVGRNDPFSHPRVCHRYPTCSRRLDHCLTHPVRSPVHLPIETSDAPIYVRTLPRQVSRDSHSRVLPLRVTV